jgi:hypothetical protein
VRPLTDAEARVLSLMLGNAAPDERGRLRQSGLPRSTYHAARRRIYADGWLTDRYVPSPTLFGYPETTIVVGRPYADRPNALTEAWNHEDGNVLQWLSPQLALGVFFHRGPRERRAALARIADPALASGLVVLHPEVEANGVPVYFDLEGVWVHLSGAGAMQSYPKGLPRLPERLRTEDGGARWGSRSRWAARELLQRPLLVETHGRPGHLIGPFGLPSAQRRLLEEGWLLHRVLAEPGRIPSYRGRVMDRTILLTGTRVPGRGPEALFQELTGAARVFPFLFAADEERVLLGLLGQRAPTSGEVDPADAGRRPLMALLRESLREIQIVEEATDAIRAPVDHRFDRLSPPPVPGG